MDNLPFGIGCIVLALAVMAGIGGLCIVAGAAHLRSDAEQAAEDEEQARAMGWKDV